MNVLTPVLAFVLFISALGCIPNDKVSYSIISEPPTTAVAGKEYRYNIQVSPASGQNNSEIELFSPTPPWLKVATPNTYPIAFGEPTARITAIDTDTNGTIYALIASETTSGTSDLYKISSNGTTKTLVAEEACTGYCNDLLIINDIAYVTNSLSDSDYIYGFNLRDNNPSAELINDNIPSPIGLAYKDKAIYVGSRDTNAIYQFTLANPSLSSEVITLSEQPYKLNFDSLNRLYVSFASNTIRLTPTFFASPEFAGLSYGPCVTGGVAIDSKNNVYIGNMECPKDGNVYTLPPIRKIASNGYASEPISSAGDVEAITSLPSGELLWAEKISESESRMYKTDATSLYIYGTPSVNSIGSHRVSLRVNFPSGGSEEQSYTLTVTGNPEGAFNIGGNVTNLAGGLVLQNNEFDEVSLTTSEATANTPFTFLAGQEDNTSYEVTVKTQPDYQQCTVSNGVGTVLGADITDVNVDCAFVSYSIGGAISGLTGELVLSADGVNYTYQASDTSYSITGLEALGEYTVTVVSSPTGYTCSIGSNGNVASLTGHISDADISCSQNTYSVGGSVSGLLASTSFDLKMNTMGETLNISNNGAFTFMDELAYNTTYNISVLTQPSGQACVLTNASGTVTDEVTNVSVTCTASERTLNVTVIGLPDDGTSVPMRAFGPSDGRWASENKAMTVGSSSFTNTMLDTETFDIRILSNPAGYTCTITNESPLSTDTIADGFGTVDGDVTVTVTCT